MTKAVGERLIIQANKLQGTTRFVCIRGGNVLGTNGSVVPYFISQIKTKNEARLTDKNMTRYFITLSEAIQLLFKASEKSFGGETFVMHMPACKISDLANVLIDHYGNKNTKVVEIGVRPGEKYDEVLVSRYEAPNTYEYDENYYLIFPWLHIDGFLDHYQQAKLKKVRFAEYSSSTELMNKEQIKNMLNKGGFLN